MWLCCGLRWCRTTRARSRLSAGEGDSCGHGGRAVSRRDQEAHGGTRQGHGWAAAGLRSQTLRERVAGGAKSMFPSDGDASVDHVRHSRAVIVPTAAKSLIAATDSTRESVNTVNLASAAPPVAWWLCTFDGPAQRLCIVAAALQGTSGHTAVITARSRRRRARRFPERSRSHGEAPTCTEVKL